MTGSSTGGPAKAVLTAALNAHRAGALANAVALYRQALAIEPRNADALHLLGVCLLQSGRVAPALRAFDQALEAAPRIADFWNSRGSAHRAAGDHAKAAADFAQAVVLKPGYPEALLNLGRALSILDRHGEAIDTLRKLVAQRPGDAIAQDALGAALLAAGRLDEALATFRKAVELDARLAEAQCHLGTALLQTGDSGAAIRALRRAVAIDPTFAEGHFNLGAAYQDMDRDEDALAAFRRAVELDPLFFKAWNNLGLVLRKAGKSEQAVDAFRRGIGVLQRGDVRAAPLWNNIGSALVGDTNRIPQDAIDAFRRAIALDPQSARYHRNLGYATYWRGDSMFAMEPIMRALELDPALRDDESLQQLLILLVLNEPDGAMQAHRFARRWNQSTAAHLKDTIEPHANNPAPDRLLRIGYVSPDFRQHSVAYFFEPVLRAHDRSVFEVTCYADLPAGGDATTERLKTRTDRWQDTNDLSDAQLAARIRADGIDILIDLAGHTGRNRLLAFARRPAPVQVSWIGFPATTGLDTIDWKLTNAIADPPGTTESHYSEQLWRLPGPFLCYLPAEDSPPPSDPPFKQNGHLSLGCFNNAAKIRMPVLSLWARATRAIAGSRLVLKSHVLSDAVFRKEMRDRFRQAGGDPAVLVLRGHEESHRAHLQAYEEVDIGLDTAPYNGTTTTCEALWMGVPVVTLAGDSHVSRVGASILSSLRLTDLIAHSEDEYLQVLSRLAADHEWREAMRPSLRSRIRQSALGDPDRFMPVLEDAYRAMWRRWCAAAPALGSAVGR